jgi:hypothetical protein
MAAGWPPRAPVALALALAPRPRPCFPHCPRACAGPETAIAFPHGFAAALVVTAVMTAAACGAGACLAGRAGLAAILLGWPCGP